MPDLSPDEVDREHQLAERPLTRGDCAGAARPCPWVGCKFHLYFEVHAITGAIRIHHPNLEPWELAETCSLDVADRGGATLEVVGGLFNITRERVRQVETKAAFQARARAMELGIEDKDAWFTHPQGTDMPEGG
jgi:hypothetical protein